MPTEPCDACRALIDNPSSTDEPHVALTTDDRATLYFANETTEHYGCRTCGTTFDRIETRASGSVQWTRTG